MLQTSIKYLEQQWWRDRETAQWVKAVAAKPGNLSLIPESHAETEGYKDVGLYFDFHMDAMACVPLLHQKTNVKYVKEMLKKG